MSLKKDLCIFVHSKTLVEKEQYWDYLKYHRNIGYSLPCFIDENTILTSS
uniref:Uncharacterized protein n=1 Tax=Schistosoma mansoni TaxID=6183 RepID=A0A5K4F6R3_SCHMA